MRQATERIRDIKLNALLEITKAINNNISTKQLLETYQEILQKQLSIDRLVLFINDETWKCVFHYGVENEYEDIDPETDLLPITDIGIINFSKKKLNKSFEVVVPVFHKKQPLAYVLIGDIEDKVELSPTIKHLPFVQTITNIIVVAIENKKLAKENIRQAAMQKELELASEMQAMLFPNSLPNNKILDAGAYYLPHQQVGGDYYDFLWLNESECIFCVADVSGKGVAAALLMSNFQANLRILVKHTFSLTELIRELNNVVYDNAKGEKFITLFIAKYNVTSRFLTYINAGHNHPLLVSGKEVDILNTGCTGLGMFDKIDKIKEGVVHIPNKSVITCYTDGLVELENKNKEEFGIERLAKLIKQNFGISSKKLNALIMDMAIEHKGKMNYIDDVAIFSIRIH